MRRITRALRKGDMFGGQWGITFDGEDTHKTSLGFCCSILYGLIVVVTLVYFWLQFMDTANPTLGSEILIGSEFPLLNFGNHKFFFTISAIYEGRPLHYEEIFKIVDIKLDSVVESVDPADDTIKSVATEKGLHQCRPSDFEIDGKEINTSHETKKGDFTICPDDKNLRMKGHVEDERFEYIRIQFIRCTSNCWANITTELENVHLQFGFTEAAVIPSSYDYPFEYHLNKEYTFHLDERVEYFRKFFFRTLEVDTDKGIFTEDVVQHSSLDLFNLIYEDGHRHSPDIPYLELRLLSSNHNLYIQRSYVKFQDFLGNVGGVTSIAAVIIALFYSYYNDISLKLYVMNDTLFKYHVQKTGRKITFFNVVKFILYEKFGKCCGCFSEETKRLSKLYFSGENKLGNSMDVNKLVQTGNDVQIMKRIMFNQEQLLLISKVTNDDLIRQAEEDEAEAEKGEEMTEEEKDLCKKEELEKAHKYLQKGGWKDDVEMRVNVFLKNSIASGEKYTNSKKGGVLSLKKEVAPDGDVVDISAVANADERGEIRPPSIGGPRGGTLSRITPGSNKIEMKGDGDK